jgi:predicted dithiol-disulfide oxidoreductase (DUF899 family)
MTSAEIAHPRIVSRDQWRLERIRHLQNEKELTQHRDQVAAERRRLPMRRVEKRYVFGGPQGPVELAEIFAGHPQLIIYHFMFDPDWERGCPGCTGFVDALGDLSMLAERNTSFALVSRAAQPKLAAYAASKSWPWAWFSSLGTDFNYDFHVTLDEAVAPVEYNYRNKSDLESANSEALTKGEAHGLSVFFRAGDDVFHTYSSYARGVENLTNSYALLDVTPYGRQEDWENSPSGWPQRPTYG